MALLQKNMDDLKSQVQDTICAGTAQKLSIRYATFFSSVLKDKLTEEAYVRYMVPDEFIYDMP